MALSGLVRTRVIDFLLSLCNKKEDLAGEKRSKSLIRFKRVIEHKDEEHTFHVSL